MSDIPRAVRALQLPHLRRGLLLGTLLLPPAVGVAALTGPGDWLLLRAAGWWLVGTGAVVHWRLSPLVPLHLRRRPGARWRRWAREPLGALLFGVVATLPVAALVPFVPLRGGPVPLPAGELQLAALAGVFLGGMAGLAAWEQRIGRAGRRVAARRAARQRRSPSGAV